MAVVIRLARHGRKKKPFYRIVATEKSSPRDGRFLEVLGTFDPNKENDQVSINLERVEHWTNHGAVPSRQANQLIKKIKVS